VDSKDRFSNRVEAYAKYRPGYPKEAVDYLYDEAGIRPGSRIADVGAGTGIFSRLLLERGSRVIAVEPNDAMRSAAEQALGGHPNFRAVPGSAESTGLPDQSVDFVVCAQSFHWFDRDAAKREFRRILKPGGKVIILWYTRRTKGNPAVEDYERLLHTYAIDYKAVSHRNVSKSMLLSFFGEGTMLEQRFGMQLKYDFDGLKGFVLSSSYCPLPDHPNYEPMMTGLRNLFDRHHRNGVVIFDYETEIYWGEVL
jgi:SAM-dependent methyltransferase